jgi:phosphatidylglycerophosphatase A
VETAVLTSALLAGYFDGWEIVLVLAVVLILVGARMLPEMSRGLGQGIREFWKATRDATDELNPKESGLVYEAITCDNRTAEFVYPHRSELPEFLRSMILFLAQGFGVGRIPFAPGTFGSLVGLAWVAALLATRRYELFLLGALLGVGLSVWLCGAAEKILKQKDPSSVVLDEIIALPFCFLPWVTSLWLKNGQMPALNIFWTGNGLLVVAGIFVLFRLFDIWKPWPIRWADSSVKGGLGAMLDDMLAGLLAHIALRLLL